MADELTIRATLSFTKNSTNVELSAGPSDFDVTGTNAMKHRQEIGTSEEAVTIGNVAAGGYILVVNRDATNYVTLRPGSGLTDLIRLEAGDFALFRLDDSATLYALANTAACEIEYAIIDA